MRIEYKHNIPETDPRDIWQLPNYSQHGEGYLCIAARCEKVHLPEVPSWVERMPARAVIAELHATLNLIDEIRIHLQRKVPLADADLELFKLHMQLCMRIDDLSGVR